jgi:hypothetical protein
MGRDQKMHFTRIFFFEMGRDRKIHFLKMDVTKKMHFPAFFLEMGRDQKMHFTRIFLNENRRRKIFASVCVPR